MSASVGDVSEDGAGVVDDGKVGLVAEGEDATVGDDEGKAERVAEADDKFLLKKKCPI
jgi:hypothetical protein